MFLLNKLEIVEKNDELTISGVVQAMMYEDIENLPPGGGLDSKSVFFYFSLFKYFNVCVDNHVFLLIR